MMPKRTFVMGRSVGVAGKISSLLLNGRRNVDTRPGLVAHAAFFNGVRRFPSARRAGFLMPLSACARLSFNTDIKSITLDGARFVDAASGNSFPPVSTFLW